MMMTNADSFALYVCTEKQTEQLFYLLYHSLLIVCYYSVLVCECCK